jgi:prevent-host-death family protein
MTQVNMHDAKTHLSRLVERAGAGEDIVIAKAGKPLVRLVPCETTRKRREFGKYKDQIVMAPDFDELPADMQAAFEGYDL